MTGSNPRRGARLWLCVPPTLACAADVAMTLAGQSRGYWSGNYREVAEFNPLARLLLERHPIAFVIAGCASCVLVGAAMFWLNLRLAMALGFIVTFGHLVAAAAWMARSGPVGIVAAIAALIAGERLITLSWRQTGAVAR
jgi:hypothetical protein